MAEQKMREPKMDMQDNVLREKSLYEKIQNVRVALLKSGIVKEKKAGARFAYIELKDFIQPLNELMQKERMTAIVDFVDSETVDKDTGIVNTVSKAVITAIDFDSDVRHSVSMAMRDGKVGGGGNHPMQELGAVQTYARRYLYFALFDIAESDTLDGQSSQGIKHEQEVAKKITDVQIKTLKAFGLSDANLVEFAKYCKVKEVKDIPFDTAAAQIKVLEKKQGAKKPEDDIPPKQGGAE